MPTLDWIGKKAVLNHHRQVPYKLLHCNRELSAGDADAGNLLVQGDNLEALKALLPYYGGKVKCIYIDPPYNTGNEDWVYNDNVNSPEIRQWLRQTVGKEGEDLSRHDKWLCMMYPRLSLLKSFLCDAGILMMSVDDNEQARARQLLDEIMGPANFVAQLVWEKGKKNDAKHFSIGHEYIVVYASSKAKLKDDTWRIEKDGVAEIGAEYLRLRATCGEDFLAISKGLAQFYKRLPKGHPSKKYSRARHGDRRGVWRDQQITWHGGGGPRYEIPHPATGKPCKIPDEGWRFVEETMLQKIRDDWIVFRKDHSKPPFLKQYIFMVDDSEKDEDLNEGTKEVLSSVFYRHSQPSVDLQRALFGKKVFPNPKDHEILARLMRYVTKSDKNAIFLDSFAGSGTTAHAVMAQNEVDSGKRRFILVEMDEAICREITSQRIRKVIDGYGDTPGLGGGFRFCKLGNPLFDEAGNIRDEVRFADLAAHVFFTETGSPIPKRSIGKTPLLGVYGGRAVYLLFNGVLGDKTPTGGNVLTGAVLAGLPKHDGPRIVYGEGCRLSAARLKREGIEFRQVPYEVKAS